jgi:hypothetical protein
LDIIWGESFTQEITQNVPQFKLAETIEQPDQFCQSLCREQAFSQGLSLGVKVDLY